MGHLGHCCSLIAIPGPLGAAAAGSVSHVSPGERASIHAVQFGGHYTSGANHERTSRPSKKIDLCDGR
jgi:hypothetical protein